MKKAEVKTGIKNPRFVILTVVSMNENSFGLQDHNFPFQASEVFITFLNGYFNLENSLLAYNNHGRLTNPQINTWIQDNNLHIASEPVKLVFEIQKKGSRYHYTLYRTQGNYLDKFLN